MYIGLHLFTGLPKSKQLRIFKKIKIHIIDVFVFIAIYSPLLRVVEEHMQFYSHMASYSLNMRKKYKIVIL